MNRNAELRKDGFAEIECESSVEVVGIGVAAQKAFATFKRSGRHDTEETGTKLGGKSVSRVDELTGDLQANNGTRQLRQTRWVKQPGSDRQNDPDLAAAAVEAIEWLTTVPQETIRVTACNGWLHLEGTLSSGSQRNTVEEVTRHLPGVKGLTNSVTINAGLGQADMRAVR